METAETVELTYRRVGETYVGSIAGEEATWSSFAAMMTDAHRWLIARSNAGLLIQRTDRDGLLPVQLGDKELELLRTDPVAYIAAHTISHRTVDLSHGKRSRLAEQERYVVPKSAGLRAGHDTLAAAFGERVYVRLRAVEDGHQLEHPLTGRWVPLGTDKWVQRVDFEVVLTSSNGWVSFKVLDLLEAPAARYYLPREWNAYGGWISKDQLQEMYNQFIKERDHVVEQFQ